MSYEEYRRNAARCWAAAERAQDLIVRRTLSEMAAAWERLADHADRNSNGTPSSGLTSPRQPTQETDTDA